MEKVEVKDYKGNIIFVYYIVKQQNKDNDVEI